MHTDQTDTHVHYYIIIYIACTCEGLKAIYLEVIGLQTLYARRGLFRREFHWDGINPKERVWHQTRTLHFQQVWDNLILHMHNITTFEIYATLTIRKYLIPLVQNNSKIIIISEIFPDVWDHKIASIQHTTRYRTSYLSFKSKA